MWDFSLGNEVIVRAIEKNIDLTVFFFKFYGVVGLTAMDHCRLLTTCVYGDPIFFKHHKGIVQYLFLFPTRIFYAITAYVNDFLLMILKLPLDNISPLFLGQFRQRIKRPFNLIAREARQHQVAVGFLIDVLLVF